jgi:hypothetical protein
MKNKQSKGQPKTGKRPKKDVLKSQLSDIIKKSEDRDVVVTCWGCNGVFFKEIATIFPYEAHKNGRVFKTKAYFCPNCDNRIKVGEVVKED